MPFSGIVKLAANFYRPGGRGLKIGTVGDVLFCLLRRQVRALLPRYHFVEVLFRSRLVQLEAHAATAF
jgi:hypothetical protein